MSFSYECEINDAKFSFLTPEALDPGELFSIAAYYFLEFNHMSFNIDENLEKLCNVRKVEEFVLKNEKYYKTGKRRIKGQYTEEELNDSVLPGLFTVQVKWVNELYTYRIVCAKIAQEAFDSVFEWYRNNKDIVSIELYFTTLQHLRTTCNVPHMPAILTVVFMNVHSQPNFNSFPLLTWRNPDIA